jgi:hypothetical protein
MQDLGELERRITDALNRIGAGIESLGTSPASSEDGTLARLQAELAAERETSAALRRELGAARSPIPAAVLEGDEAALRARIEQMTRQLDVQGLEMHRMRKTMVQLRENLRGLRRAQAANLADPEQINRAMQAEIEAMRVARLSEVAELDEIISELTPHIREEAADA